ncbi:MAG: hypothetical protein E2O68_08415 [Deltaproteobacteria bacterium]|nr:MAG: hypothetical protein E2O68_08415 [Deltaproteobacteria bacterium]
MKLLIAALILLGSSSLMAKPITLESVIKKEPVVKIMPTFGVMKLKSDYLDYNSTISTGVALDFMLSSRFSVGVNFTFSLFELYEDHFAYSSNEMDLKQYDLGIFTKFFIIPHGVIRPFIATGISYIHNKMNYADDAYAYYDDDYTFGTVAGTVAVGSEVRFSRNIGLIIDGRFTQNFASGLNRRYGDSTNSIYGYVPLAMERIEYDLEDAYSLALNVGLIILF